MTEFLSSISSEVFLSTEMSTSEGTPAGKSAGKTAVVSSLNERRLKAARRGEHSMVADPGAVIRISELTREEAEEVWIEAVKIWSPFGNSSNEVDRVMFRNAFALAVLEATSADEENLGTRFSFNGAWYDLYAIRDAVNLTVANKPNPLRCFVRSFRDAVIPLTIMDTLDDPDNLEIRQSLAMRTGGPVEHAKYMFDTAEAAIRKSGRTFSSTEMNLVRHYRAARTNAAQVSGQSIGMETAANDISSSVRKNTGVVSSASADVGASKQRLKFASVV